MKSEREIRSDECEQLALAFDREAEAAGGLKNLYSATEQAARLRARYTAESKDGLPTESDYEKGRRDATEEIVAWLESEQGTATTPEYRRIERVLKHTADLIREGGHLTKDPDTSDHVVAEK
jgi:hypothetical protein